MTQKNPTCFHQSASSIAAFKACPTRYRLSYREGIRTAEDTDSQRQGTNWHKMHEVYYDYMAHKGTVCHTDPTPEGGLAAVVAHLNQAYATCPAHKDLKDWALERQILLTCFVAYLWYWANDPIEVLASEVAFNLPIHVPKLGLPLPMAEVQRVGKIDHIVRWHGMVGTVERKSTSRSILPDSDYWDKSKKDTQVSMYALAFRELIDTGQLAHLPPLALKEGEAMPNIGSTLYDCWHKPTISPKMLTQADTKAFIETGEYCGQKFDVRENYDDGPEKPCTGITVNLDEDCEIEQGKKGFAIRETVDMFGARLLQDIQQRPDFYFQRKEITRTDAELAKFRTEGYNIYQTMKTMDNTGHWYENEQQCRATYPCPMIPICYGPGADKVCEENLTPEGFRRIFVDLRVNGVTPDD